MTYNDPFRLAPAPRRSKATPPLARPEPVRFVVEQPGQPPRHISLTARQAAALAQLATPEGLAGGTQAAARAVNDLRAMGMLVVTLRQPRADGGGGWTARYRLAAGVSLAPEAER